MKEQWKEKEPQFPNFEKPEDFIWKTTKVLLGAW